MLAVVIASVVHMNVNSQQVMDDYYVDANNLAYAGTATGSATLKDGSGADVGLSAEIAAGESVDVEYAEGDIAGQAIVSYWENGSGD